MLTDRSTIGDLVRHWARLTPDAVAVVAPGRDALTYGAYGTQVAYAGEVFAGLGLGRGRRIAMAVPTGAEAAVCYASICSHATAAPLNPGYTAEEFAAYFENLRADALVVMRGSDTAARAAAAARGMPVIELISEPDAPAGTFHLAANAPRGQRATDDSPRCDDVASVLQSSGTTSRSKVIPLTHRNIIARAMYENAWYGIGPTDRVLCLNPLYHHSGLKMGVIEPLQSGSSTVAVTRSGAAGFLDLMASCRPSWCSGSATFFHEIARKAGPDAAALRLHEVRFFRSGSTRLDPAVADAIERTFGVPVLNAYSSSEVGMMASNPLPPGARRPETVGLPIGPEMAVLDDDGTPLPAGEAGEIAARGPTVTAGYENDDAANEAAFRDGWFRTGDMGCFDAAGYLSLTGRVKEIINRGGEKIAPAEIDAALETHPAVAEAAAFGFPHPTLNELVVAAVVAAPSVSLSEKELRQHLRGKLAPTKVPAKIFFVEALPRNGNGKLQRNRLRELLADGGARQRPTEESVV